MNQTPCQELQESNIFQNISYISAESGVKAQDNFAASKVRLPFSNIRLPSTDDFSKAKIMELQEQMLKLRKDISQKQCSFSKEKSHLLSRIELLSQQNIQIKHRQQSLIQLNHTLELAINSQDQITSRANQKDQTELKMKKQEIEKKDKNIKELKKMLEQYKHHIRRLEQQKHTILEAKDKRICQLQQQNRQLLNQKDEQENKLKKLLNTKYCNKELVSAIYGALNIHMAEQLSFEDLESNSNYFDESPIPKRGFNMDKKGKGNQFDTSYSRISSHSIISQLNNNSNKYLPSESEEDYEQSERLLCQVCRKVYSQPEFIRHMDKCQEIAGLHQRREMLERAIHDIDQEQRVSISQRKWKNKNCQQRSPLKPLIANDRSTSRLKDKKTFQMPQKDQSKGYKVHLRPPQGRYHSNNFY